MIFCMGTCTHNYHVLADHPLHEARLAHQRRYAKNATICTIAILDFDPRSVSLHMIQRVSGHEIGSLAEIKIRRKDICGTLRANPDHLDNRFHVPMCP